MESLLNQKYSPTALALSQVTTAPDTVKTQFDRGRDQEEVARLLNAGSVAYAQGGRRVDINLDDLIATALDDPQAMSSENKAFRGINFADLQTAYRQFCKERRRYAGAGGRSRARPSTTTSRPTGICPITPSSEGIKLPAPSVVLDRKRANAWPRWPRGTTAARMGFPRRHSRARAEGVPGGRRQALLPAPGHRRARPDPRLHRQSRPVRTGGGTT